MERCLIRLRRRHITYSLPFLIQTSSLNHFKLTSLLATWVNENEQNKVSVKLCLRSACLVRKRRQPKEQVSLDPFHDRVITKKNTDAYSEKSKKSLCDLMVELDTDSLTAPFSNTLINAAESSLKAKQKILCLMMVIVMFSL